MWCFSVSTYFVRYSALYILLKNTGKHLNDGGMGPKWVDYIVWNVLFPLLPDLIEEYLVKIMFNNNRSVGFHRDLWTWLEVKAQKKLDCFEQGHGFVQKNMGDSSKFGGRRGLSQCMRGSFQDATLCEIPGDLRFENVSKHSDKHWLSEVLPLENDPKFAVVHPNNRWKKSNKILMAVFFKWGEEHRICFDWGAFRTFRGKGRVNCHTPPLGET